MDSRATLTRRSFAFLLDNALVILTLCVGYYVWLFFTARKGTTPGKRMLGIRIHDAESGRVVSAWRVLLREGVGKLLLPGAIFGVVDLVAATTTADGVFAVFWIAGVLSPFVTSERRSLWDYLAGTTIRRSVPGRMEPAPGPGQLPSKLPAIDGYKRFEDALPSRRTPIR